MAEKKYTVKTPNPGFTGVREGVHFAGGKAKTDKKTATKLVKFWGYSCPELFPENTGKDPKAEPESEEGPESIKRFEKSSVIKKWRSAVKAVNEYAFESTDELDAFIDGEKRASVLKAYEARKETLASN